MIAEAMLKSHPRPPIAELPVLVACIEECSNCEIACVICADASLAEDDVDAMVRCIRLCLDCADACDDTLRIISRQTDPDAATQRATLEACRATCRACAEECQHHADHHEHCRLCADECRRCERTCDDLLAALRAA